MTPTEEFEVAATDAAQVFASSFERGNLGIPKGALDFSKQSLVHLDAYLVKLRAKDPGPEAKKVIGMGAGAYLAEVLRRRSPVKLRWVPASVLPAQSPDDPFLLATPKNLVFLVMGKPRKLLEQGEGDTLVRFADEVHELCSREATSL